jgi:hypothetical protein
MGIPLALTLRGVAPMAALRRCAADRTDSILDWNPGTGVKTRPKKGFPRIRTPFALFSFTHERDGSHRLGKRRAIDFLNAGVSRRLAGVEG